MWSYKAARSRGWKYSGPEVPIAPTNIKIKDHYNN